MKDPNSTRYPLSSGRKDSAWTPRDKIDEQAPDVFPVRTPDDSVRTPDVKSGNPDKSVRTPDAVRSSGTSLTKSGIPSGLGVASAPPTKPNLFQVNKSGSNAYVPPIPFPRRFAKQKKEQSDKDILEVLSKV